MELNKDDKLKLRIVFWGCEPLPVHRRWFVGRNVLGKDDPVLGGRHINFYRDTTDHSLYAEADGRWYSAIITYGSQEPVA